MYARVVTGQYQPGKLDEGEQIYRESILPEARQQPGFKGALVLQRAVAAGDPPVEDIASTVWKDQTRMPVPSERIHQETLLHTGELRS